MVQMLVKTHSEISFHHDQQIRYTCKMNRQQITLATLEKHTPEITFKKITVLGKWHLNSKTR
jgi:hypothetical protein